MAILALIGERLYEFSQQPDVSTARKIYCNHVGDQNSFEDEMEKVGIEFYYEFNLYE